MMTETFKKYVRSLEFCVKRMQHQESSENFRTSSTGADIRKVLLCYEWNMYTSIHPDDTSNLPVRHFFFPAPTPFVLGVALVSLQGQHTLSLQALNCIPRGASLICSIDFHFLFPSIFDPAYFLRLSFFRRWQELTLFQYFNAIFPFFSSNLLFSFPQRSALDMRKALNSYSFFRHHVK